MKLKQLALKPSFWLLSLIIALAAFLRFYNLPHNVMFEGDQGRDALIVSQIFKDNDPVFIGPVTSVGNMYLGPLYYYFMLPFLWLSYPSPLGPVYAVAILNILAVYLIYKFGRQMFDKQTGLLAAFFMAVSSVAVTYSRFSWNPNLAPLFGLLMIYFNWKALTKPKNWIWVFSCFAVLIQLHYLSLLAIAGAGLTWLWQLAQTWKNQDERKQKITELFKFTLLGSLVFLISLVPLILFDFKHGWLNAKAFANLLFGEPNFVQSAANLPLITKVLRVLRETEGRAMHILFEIGIGKTRQLNRWLVFGTFISLFALFIKFARKKMTQKKLALLVVLSYLLTGVLGTATYQHTIFDHYIGYLFPLTFLIYGLLTAQLTKKWLTAFFGLAFISLFTKYNLQKMPLAYGGSIERTKQTAQVILKQLQPDDQYNLVLLSETQDIDAQKFRYFLSTSDHPPLPKEKRDQANTLIIINEQHLEKPVDLPIYEIVVFPDKAVDKSFVSPAGEEILILRKN